MIQQNKAHLITGSRDLLRLMNWAEPEKGNAVQRTLFHELDENEHCVLTILKEKPLSSMDIIGYLSGLTPAGVSSVLLQLEFKGLINSLPGKRFGVIQ